MKREFWESCWQQNRIGFHMPHVHPYLKEFVSELNLEAGEPILVPLCGKSLDMIYLGQQGFEVLGVELSLQAVEAFFRENRFDAESSTEGAFRRFCGGPFEILCGDFFELEPGRIPVRAVYDRGSLVAMPPEMRPRYARHLTELLCAGSRVLLISYDYDPSQMEGPPFGVSDTEIATLYGDAFRIRKLCARDALAENSPLKARGLTALVEKAHLLIRNP